MSNYPPGFCPYCGTELTTVESPTAFRCESCDDYVFHNPIPQARVAVVDGDRMLLAEIPADEEKNLWSVPGGAIEADEDPPVAGVRELEEETGLRVEPEALTFFDARTYEKWDGLYKVALLYAVDATATSGTVVPDGVEHTDARFWTPFEFEAAGQTLGEFYNLPARYRDVEWWLHSARTALSE